MSYATIADVSASASLARRVAACIAEQTPGVAENPQHLAVLHMPRLAAQPGWAAAWASAVAAGITDPGADEGAITDGMILAGVQSALGTPTP